MAKKQKFNRVYIHLILDGRDMPERSAIPLVKKLNKKIKQLGIGTIVSVIGRFYGMDRDTNWDRTEKCYFLMVDGKGFRAKTAIEAIKKSYARGAKTDYYVHPTLIVNKKNKPLALLKDMDALIFYNFRSDRARQITAMINDLDYYPKKLKKKVDVFSVGMCSYDSDWNLPVAFDAIPVNNNLGQVIAKNGLKQLRIAETEKYAHVTFFFNSEIEKPNKKEDRVMIPSPKVKSYDLQPEMSAYKITKKLRPFLGKYDLIVLNYANPDLVGHSGVFKATVKACSVVDECAGKVIKKALEKDYVIFLTADHGNADHMFYDNGQVDPSHGFNPVLLTLISDDEKLKKIKLKKGGQKDLAPTVLKVMGLKKPRGMTGKTLF